MASWPKGGWLTRRAEGERGWTNNAWKSCVHLLVLIFSAMVFFGNK